VGLKRCLRTARQAVIISEKSHANDWPLKILILVIAIAYTCAVIQGQRLKLGGVHKYIGRLTECRQPERRHSSFWIGLLASIVGDWNGVLSINSC
jgi:hypothetical protein